MKASYPRFFRWYEIALLVILFAYLIFVPVYAYLKNGSLFIILLYFGYICVVVFLFRRDKIYISENNSLWAGAHYIKIPSIHTIEYKDSGGIIVYYVFQGSERKHTFLVKDEYREKLIDDLKQINPNIKRKQQIDDEV